MNATQLAAFRIYPKEATRAYWDKKKAFVDKVKTRKTGTGLGDELDKAAKVYEAIGFKTSNNMYHFQEATFEKLKEHKAYWDKHYVQRVTPAIKALKKAGEKARTVSMTPELTADSKKAAAKIMAALQHRATELEGIKTEYQKDLKTWADFFANQKAK